MPWEVWSSSSAPAGEAWTAKYDDFNRIEERKLLAGPGFVEATWGFTYAEGGVSTETEPEGTEITRTHNARGLLEAEVLKSGKVTSDEEERLTRYFYDGSWLKKVEVTEGQSRLVVDRTEPGAIDDLGRTPREVESWSAPARSYRYESQTQWDRRQAVVTERWSMAGENLGRREATLDTDSLGNVVRHTQAGAIDRWDYGADGKLLWTLPKGFVETAGTRYSYEESGRLKSQSFNDEVTIYSYHPDGQLHTVEDPSGRVRTLLYNSRGSWSRSPTAWTTTSPGPTSWITTVPAIPPVSARARTRARSGRTPTVRGASASSLQCSRATSGSSGTSTTAMPG